MFDINTEYFNGYEWKRICDYTIGDKVLAYQGVNGESHLVEPVQILMEDRLAGFYRYNGRMRSTLSDEHIIVYKDGDELKEIKQKEIVDGFDKPIPASCYWVEGNLELSLNKMLEFLNSDIKEEYSKLYSLSYECRMELLNSIVNAEDTYYTYVWQKAILVYSLLAFSNECAPLCVRLRDKLYSVVWVSHKDTRGKGFYRTYHKNVGYHMVNGKKEKLPPFTSCVAKGEYGIILPDSYYLVCKNKNHIFISGGY